MPCTLCTTALKTAFPALATLAFIGMAAPADATTQSNLVACKAKIVLDGHVDAERDRIDFDSATRTKITLNISADDRAERSVTCKIRRGKVVSLSEDGTILLAKNATMKVTSSADSAGN